MRKKKDAFKGCLAYRRWVYPWTEFSAVPAYNPWYNGNPCNMHLLDVSAKVKKGIQDRDRQSLTPLIHPYINPYGSFLLDMSTRFPLARSRQRWQPDLRDQRDAKH